MFKGKTSQPVKTTYLPPLDVLKCIHGIIWNGSLFTMSSLALFINIETTETALSQLKRAYEHKHKKKRHL